MAKGDFNIEEPDYYADDESISEDNLDKNSEETVKQEPKKTTPTDLYRQDYGENSDFSNIGVNKDLNYIDNSNVVFEDKSDLTPEERVKDFLSSINKQVVIVIAGILLLILVTLLVIFAYISKDRASYYTNIIVPKVVYMGETGAVSVIANGKKDLDQTVTKFTSKNPKVLTVLNEEVKGKETVNTLVPIQEGKSTIELVSTLNGKNMAKEKKQIIVCPAFNNDLLLNENISVVEGTAYDLKIDFGEGECSKDIIYESSDESIMTVNDAGRIMGVKAGNAILTIKKGARSISVNVAITKEHVEMKSFTVTPEKVQLTPGENIRIKIGYNPINSTSTSMYFTTTDDTVATISDGGLITALKPGEVTITVHPLNTTMYKEIKVVVAKEVSSEGTEVTEITLNKNELNMTQGETEKILVTLTPDNAKNKKVSWKSSDESVVSITGNGVVLAKKEGTADVTVTANNNISKTVRVKVAKMRPPMITASDNIDTNQWHNRAYVLNFTGSENGVSYYYGKTESQMNNKGSRVTIKQDEKATYYVKACKNNVCSSTVKYISKLDATKPKIQTVAGIDTTATKQDVVKIAMQDSTSLVQRWCVTTVDSSNTCKWTTIQTALSPVVSYTATYNGTYYAFAKDTAGNISDGYQFQITNIE